MSILHEVFLAQSFSSSGAVLDDDGQAALKTFFQSGGVYCGVHAASACLQNDTNYQQAVGGKFLNCTVPIRAGSPDEPVAIFDYHPTISPNPTFIRLNTTFPATAVVPDRWTFVSPEPS